MSGWLVGLMAYFVLDSIGLIMLAGKRVRYTWPLVTFSVLVNLGWIVLAGELIGRAR